MKSKSLAVLGLATAFATSQAGVTIYFDRAQSLADSRVSGGSLVNEGFDGFSPGTDLTSSTVSGALLLAPSTSPLMVILGSAGVRNPMTPSSGLNVLSPGGSNTSLEDDDLRVDVAPTNAMGMDVVFDVPDGASFVGVSWLDASGNVLGSNGFIPDVNGAPFTFCGIVSDSSNVVSMRFDEFDGSANDDHVAYDSLVYGGVPEPSTWAAMTIGAILLMRRRRA